MPHFCERKYFIFKKIIKKITFMDEIAELRKKITDLVDNIKAHSDRFTGKKHLPTLELNVFLAKLNRLYETTVVLRYLMDKEEMEKLTPFVEKELTDMQWQQTPGQRELTENVIPEMPEEPLPEINESVNTGDIAEKEPVIESTEQPTEEPSLENTVAENIKAESTVENTENQGIQEAVGEPEAKIPEETQPQNTSAGSLADQLSNQPISNLTQALSLNEKYLFANEFFNKDLNAFLLMVKRINESDNLQQAMHIFESEVSVAKDKENELVEQFIKLIVRRFL